eukprot:CAMPEP_0119298412 /NCGR_PEP_ID=MMETSP1333-20130426/596_1 /TAXON_ID=418940 /ORGANISM="Scyphosphaera apsteinii, Strain RCC1455" /LENGTH=287 /DNA_ID=CAMNT_0007299515 /DNA_START=132 /DNA_END=995 /DNA_ORIENTATION=+
MIFCAWQLIACSYPWNGEFKPTFNGSISSAEEVLDRFGALFANGKQHHLLQKEVQNANMLLQRAACTLREFHSQAHEDRKILPTLLALNAPSRSGTFVEIGAYNGVKFSNTFLLEACWNWTGLLIEANPSNFRSLVRSGRKALMVHAAACSAPQGGTVEFAKHSGLMSGMSRGDKSSVLVPCRPLATLMAEASIWKADFLSLDVEGAEELVISTVDPALFKVIVVELDGRNRSKDDNVKARLHAAGFRQERTNGEGQFIGPNSLFVREDVAYFSPPASYKYKAWSRG